jgi:hypothetical protein
MQESQADLAARIVATAAEFLHRPTATWGNGTGGTGTGGEPAALRLVAWLAPSARHVRRSFSTLRPGSADGSVDPIEVIACCS